jgi:hypothetical protein
MDPTTLGLVDRLIRPILAVPAFENIPQIVRILHLHHKTACFPWKNEGSGTTLATLETTHGNIFGGQGSAQDDDFYRGSTCRRGYAWIARKDKTIGQK